MKTHNKAFLKNSFIFDVNKKEHTIQGVKIPDDLFFAVYFSVRVNVMEGWQPLLMILKNWLLECNNQI